MNEAWVVVDLGFGDAGKGTIADFLTRSLGAGLVVRFNGGAQAGHNVVTGDGRHHTFAQFPCGLFAGALGALGPGLVLHPGGLLVEAERLRALGVPEPLARLSVDERALLVTPFQQAAGRLREIARGPAAHGSCGVGIGEAVADALAGHADTLRARDLGDAAALGRALASQRERKRAELGTASGLRDPRAAAEWGLIDDETSVARTLALWATLGGALRVVTGSQLLGQIERERVVIFEGAQGVLLDEAYGFHPHTTWSDCTPRGALALAGAASAEPSAAPRVVRLGVIRAYATRHGAGPFPTHDPAHDARHPDPHNGADGWQGAFRSGPLDLVLLRYALEVSGGIDGLALTCLDRVSDPLPLATAYETAGPAAEGLVDRDPGGSIVRLVPGAHADLAQRQRLGALLRSVRPRLEWIARDRLGQRLEQELGVPVVIESWGPTAADKCFRREPRELRRVAGGYGPFAGQPRSGS